jgi:hypothetical protein
MPHYKVSFFKNLQSSEGQQFKALQHVVQLHSASPEEAVKCACEEFERCSGISHWKLHADTMEAVVVGDDN